MVQSIVAIDCMIAYVLFRTQPARMCARAIPGMYLIFLNIQIIGI